MARANAQPLQTPSGPSPDPHEWQALRGELISLLEQVEGRYVRSPKEEPSISGVAGIAERMRDLREQVTGGAETDSRRQEALRSVKRAVDRFSEREEPEAAGPAVPSPNALQAAISEIRARQQAQEAHSMSQPSFARVAFNDDRPEGMPRFEELARSVSGISSRLERLEVELKAQRHDQASIRDIAEQVSQVSHVVELLAGAVGETGHVKRLEGQIASLAKLITEGRQVDMGALNKRIDDVSTTVERLADLQIQHVSREKDMPDLVKRLDDVSSTVERLAELQVQHVAREKDMPSIGAKLGEVSETINVLAERQGALAEGQAESLAREKQIPILGQQIGAVSASVERLVDLQTMHVRSIKDVPAQQEALRAGLLAIEKGVRNVYDRIDVVERNYALTPEDFENLTAEMARFTQALQASQPPQSLLELVDVLNSRMTDIESHDADVTGLKDEIGALRDTVIEAIAPRMAAIETRLEALDERGAALAEVVPQIAAMQTQLEEFNERGAAIEDVVPRMAAIQSQLEEFNGRGALLDDVVPTMAAIQSQLETFNERGTAINDVVPRMDALQAQLETFNQKGTVIEDVVPRMAAIQFQLETLNERVADRPPEPSVGHIEAQVRQLVARMDQTGEQLSGLARLYSEAEERDQGPDYEALADLVAARTSEAMARAEVPAGITAEDMSELEARMSRLIKAVAIDAPSTDLSDVTEGIRRVDDRLARLEEALAKLAEESAAPPVAFDLPADVPEDVPAETSADPAPLSWKDSMPLNPAEDRPLTEQPFDRPMRVMLETRIGTSRNVHPGLEDEPLDLSDLAPVGREMFGGSERRPVLSDAPDFDLPDFSQPDAGLPPRPRSVLEADDGITGTPYVSAEPVDPQTGENATSASRSSFIEAARRAAQRQQNEADAAGANSLIGRALARFQQPKGGEKPTAEAPAPEVKEPKAKKPKKVKGAKQEPQVVVEDAEVTAEVAEPADAVPAAAVIERESFLVRHRQPILLGASVVALSFLTLNLINQRMAESPAETSTVEQASANTAIAPQTAEKPTATANAAAPRAVAATPMTPPTQAAPVARMIPMVDTTATGAINTAATKFTPSAELQQMPQAFKAVGPAESTSQPEAIDSPIQVELPPESVGPKELREAAGRGDARAQFEIGAIYTEGRAVPKDLKAAATWYERAAAQGFAPAQYRLGNLYENGLGVAKDLEQARLWYQRAAEAGNRMSMHNLAALYAGGQLGKQEFASAAEWFEKAAAEGLTDSQFNLGMLYARGLGVTQNMEESYKWFALAARSGDKDAATARDDVAKSLDAETVTRVTAAIEQWQPAPINLPANFAPIGTWSQTFDPGEVIQTRDVVLGVQTLLKRLGYDVGTPDGVAGPKTADAIRAFEKATGMSESGAVNPRLLAVLSSQPV